MPLHPPTASTRQRHNHRQADWQPEAAVSMRRPAHSVPGRGPNRYHRSKGVMHIPVNAPAAPPPAAASERAACQWQRLPPWGLPAKSTSQDNLNTHPYPCPATGRGRRGRLLRPSSQAGDALQSTVSAPSSRVLLRNQPGRAQRAQGAPSRPQLRLTAHLTDHNYIRLPVDCPVGLSNSARFKPWCWRLCGSRHPGTG